MRENVEFRADDMWLRGWFYPAPGRSIAPAVALAHGFSAVKEQGLARYAEVFAAAGIGCLVYDNRNIGASDGEPRYEIDPVLQMRDYRHAVTYLQSRSDVDPDRIGIWGTSYTGGLVINAAAVDRRIKCVVSQVPYVNGVETFEQTNTRERREVLYDLFDEDRRARLRGEPPRRSPVCSFDPEAPDSTPGNRTFHFFHAFDDDASFGWPNEVTVRSLELRLEYDCLAFVRHVAPTPLLMIVASEDEITPTGLAIRAFESAGEPKKLHMITGDHYRPYLEAFDEASSVARDWLSAHLLD